VRVRPSRWASALLAACTGFAALAMCCLTDQAAAQEIVYEEEQIKAAFLYHFATFVQWPEAPPSDGVFVIAVLGADRVASELEELLPGRRIQDRPMDVRRLRSIDQLQDEAVVFIGADASSRLPDVIDKLEDRPMLVVTETPGALKDGSMINFQLVDQRVRFEISRTAAERAGLELSSRLLSAAMFVDSTSAVPALPGVIYARGAPSPRLQ